jgi:hypothetical protein
MEPEYWFVRDGVSRAAHHWDYIRNRAHFALCGHEFDGGIVSERSDRPKRVCRACQELLPIYEARWWREKAHSLTEEADRLWEKIDNQRNQLHQVQAALARRSKEKTQPAKRQRPKPKSDFRQYREEDRRRDDLIDRRPKRPWLGNATSIKSVTSGGLPGHGKRR